ncbi:sensor histidine kinase [Candidatus Solirubrobacter pratensis]|uniref:sensor histidine kinase n=1 Tax=Candidatus Solirubrobacter pratensis TaxID=1298857 RepID=UPI0004106237|nr:GAF domain-containing protein [Candidatus Solirubrobacter pratensis]
MAAETSPDDILTKIAEEVGLLLRVEVVVIHRFESDGDGTVVARWGEQVGDAFPVGRRARPDGRSATAAVYRTQQPARFEHYEAASGSIGLGARSLGVRTGIASPILVEGRLWGAIAAGTTRLDPLPADAESRLAGFADLAATAIASVEARAEIQRLADEQAALRRVATMVAQGRPPDEVFATVATEVGRVGGAETAVIHRFDPDGLSTIVASYGRLQDSFWVGSRWSMEGQSVAAGVYRTGKPARFDHYETAAGSIGVSAHDLGIRSGVASPIVVNGRLWGAIAAGTTRPRPLPPDAEPRMAAFTELAATAIANVQARADLAASRARIVLTADEERTRVARDLHDGAQQRLVHTILVLKLASNTLERDPHESAPLVEEALQQAQIAMDELRELAHGILPSVLTRGGLRAAVDSIVSRMSIPVDVDISVGRCARAVEATAYFVVAEALTNVAKHSRAKRATVSAHLDNGILQLEVRDDGIGGARRDGTGLVGLSDRVAAFEGSLRVVNPAQGGTVVEASIPVR